MAQFLQSKTSRRTDAAYGGSVGNRTRFLTEAVRAVAAEWPKDRVGVGLSPNSPYNGVSGTKESKSSGSESLLGLYSTRGNHGPIFKNKVVR
jgi:2,4-dienoyl-CoA reductase-like NADH-dependent reductase (Old Yellow Enzyme family)